MVIKTLAQIIFWIFLLVKAITNPPKKQLKRLALNFKKKQIPLVNVQTYVSK